MIDLLLASVAIVLLTFTSAEYDVGKICQLVQPGTKLSSLETCPKHYTCVGNNMFYAGFCPKGSVFDKNFQICAPESESTCYYGIDNPCHNKHKQFSYCSKGCNWYNWCVNGQIAGNSTCPPKQKFDVPSSSCIYGECNTNGQSDIPDICDIVPEGIYFGDFENCGGWHKCVSRKQESGFCQGSLVFSVATAECRVMEENMCQRTSNVVKAHASGPPQEACTYVNQVVADLNVCSLYYVCVKATHYPEVTYRWEQRSCKTGYYDVISESCNNTFLARPYPGCDRCELKAKSSRNFSYMVNAVDPNCAEYLVCNNGRRVGATTTSCGNYQFFDEVSQSCDENAVRFEQYVSYNGACQDYTCSDSRECSLTPYE